jgi:Na+-driven multidrug efflux pump
MAISCLLFLASGDLIFIIYHSSESVIEYGLPALKYYAFAILFMGVSNSVAVLYQAIGKGLEALILSVSRQGLFFIPLILILPDLWGASGVISAQAIADLLTLLLSAALVIPFFTRHRLDYLMKVEKAL